jgi:uncharacterized integral membrane protein
VFDVSDRDGPVDRSGSESTAKGLAGRPTRFWVFLGLALLGLVLVVQNSGNAEVHVLWFSIRMPLVFFLVAMVLIGVGLDRAWTWRQRRR